MIVSHSFVYSFMCINTAFSHLSLHRITPSSSSTLHRPLDICTGFLCVKAKTYYLLLILLLLYKKHLMGLNTCQIYVYVTKHPDPSGHLVLSVSRIKTMRGEAAFCFYAPHLWNKFPDYLSSNWAKIVCSFKSRLKTYRSLWLYKKLDK